jgi:uncharacterized membrane protein (DUF106 family)
MEKRSPIYWADLKQSLRWACLVGGVLLTTVKMSVALYTDHREALEAMRDEAKETRAGVEQTKSELLEMRKDVEKLEQAKCNEISTIGAELRSLQSQINELFRGRR